MLSDRTHVLGVLIVLVLLAGCGGGDAGTATTTGPSSVDTTASDPSTGTDAGTATTTAPSSGDSTIPELSSGTADAEYTFVEGDTWTYSVTQTGSTRELTLEVTSVDGDDVTLTQTFVDGNETDERLYTDTDAELLRNTSATLLVLHLPQVLVADHELSEGNSWTPEENVSVDLTFFGETETFDYAVAGQTIEVTGTDSYGGIECYTVEFTEVTSDGEVMSETCVRPDGAFALYLNRTTETGFQLSEWELTNRSR